MTLKLKPPVPSVQGALSTLEALGTSVRGTAGCIEFSVTVDVRPEGAIHLVERWEGEIDFHRHLRSDGFKRILDLMEISQEPPDLHVFQAEETAGLGLVEGIRSRTAQG